MGLISKNLIQLFIALLILIFAVNVNGDESTLKSSDINNTNSNININESNNSNNIINKQIINNNLSRCPVKTNKAGVYLYSDPKLCNVYHECNCTDGNSSFCSVVKTNVCPTGLVFLNITNKCEPIELYGCDTSYLQSIQLPGTKNNSTSVENDYNENQRQSQKSYDTMLMAESTNITGSSDFQCPFGTNERFPDPYICNVFHVCVTRGDQTYDQPFLCPFATVFRILDSKTMYCDKRGKNDCTGKAFYRSTDDEDVYDSTTQSYNINMKKTNNLILIETNNSSQKCSFSGKIEDKLFCNLYHECQNGIDHVYVCDNQLTFNPLSEICDYPINVACLNKQIYKKVDANLLMQQNKPTPMMMTSTTTTTTVTMPTTKSSKMPPQPLVKINDDQNMNKKQQEQNKFLQSQTSLSYKNGSQINILGVNVLLNCPIGMKNYLNPDKTYCNLFHHCNGNYGSIFLCEKGQAFDENANGPNNSGVCNFESMVNCAGKFILIEGGKRMPINTKSKLKFVDSLTNLNTSSNSVLLTNEKQLPIKQSSSQMSNFIYQAVANSREELVSGIPFDCRGKLNGHWKDTRYCDVFHACIGGEQKKTYSCAQLGERIYFDETTRRCEFLKNNPIGCIMNNYFQAVAPNPNTNNNVKTSLVSDEPNEAWKQFIRTREQFSCLGRMDGFYASRWCNVFYRCFIGVKTEFLCPKMLNSDRLWWVQHGSSQEIPQNSAACVWPCEAKKQCTSPGGVIFENGQGNYAESPMEAERVWRSSNCAETRDSLIDIFKINDDDFSCVGMPEGNFYSSKYCNVFYRCTSGKRKDFQCAKATNSPYDLWWNDATNQCDWPCKVQCNKPVYGSAKSAAQIQQEDRSYNEEECRRANPNFPPLNYPVQPQQPVQNNYNNYPQQPVQNNNNYPQQPGQINNNYPQQPGQINNNYPQQPGQINNNYPQQPMPIPPLPKIPLVTTQPPPTQPPQPAIQSKPINGFYPDEDFMCRTLGLIISSRYCNVYYECKSFGQLPHAAYYCVDGNFDNSLKACRSTSQVQCPFNPQLMFPYIAISESVAPEEVGCANSIGPYVIHSNRYCNIFYVCDGKSSKPLSFRCYDRESLEEAIFNRETRRCESRQVTSCQSEILSVKVRYQSSPVDHTRLPDLQPLSCRPDQQYLAEHDKYCNLYHSCILGKYQMYACLTIGSFDKTSYFYYTNGDCAAPNTAQCGPNKSIYPYDKLFPSEVNLMYKTGYAQPQSQSNQQNRFLPMISPSLSFKGKNTFSSVSLKYDLPYSPTCVSDKNNYLLSHPKYCNVFYECINGKLTTYVCIDSATGTYSGIYDSKIQKCKPFNSADCPSNLLFNPEENGQGPRIVYMDSGNNPNQLNNNIDNNSNNNIVNENTNNFVENKYIPVAEPPFKTESNFTCYGKPNGYYESEWCNIFYRCLNGKRIDAKCSPGMKNSEMLYDLWWEHQNETYDPERPLIFAGLDEDAKCEWPCKVKCKKMVWTDNGNLVQAKTIVDKERELRPECVTENNNIRLGQENNMISNKINRQQQQRVKFVPVETENLNPSGFFCENDGTYKDPLFCNLFHVCTNQKEKKTFQCRAVTGDLNQISIFDAEKNECVSRDEGFEKCNGVIFDPNFMNLPAYRDLPPSNPQQPACVKNGVFRAYDKEIKYCDLYYWCERSMSEPLYFYCDSAIYGKEASFFNPEAKKCDSSKNVKCDTPFKIYSRILTAREGIQPPVIAVVDTSNNINNNNIKKTEQTHPTHPVVEVLDTINSFIPQQQQQQPQTIQTTQRITTTSTQQPEIQSTTPVAKTPSPYMMQIVSGLLDPAPGFISLPSSQFETTFSCPLNAPGYYPNNDFCDIFHYCYNNGQFKTYVCASMQNKYQLWWSHQTEFGRRDNIFCDWPCNLVGPNSVCPPHKRVLMRERQQVPGGISQKEVLSTTCMNNEMNNNNNNNNVVMPTPSNNINKLVRDFITSTFKSKIVSEPANNNININNNNINSNQGTVTGYSPCSISDEWYVSSPVIKCSPEQRIHGFAPDPKDCSKFYRCDQNRNIAEDLSSTGYLMSCVAGLWWDQARRMCAHPSEVSCNPYNIINTQGQKDYSNTCRGLTCLQVGLLMKNHMKSIPGKSNSFYKCDGQCAVEMTCPLDLLFDNKSQRCEYIHQSNQYHHQQQPQMQPLTQPRMASYKQIDLNQNNHLNSSLLTDFLNNVNKEALLSNKSNSTSNDDQH